MPENLMQHFHDVLDDSHSRIVQPISEIRFPTSEVLLRLIVQLMANSRKFDVTFHDPEQRLRVTLRVEVD